MTDTKARPATAAEGISAEAADRALEIEFGGLRREWSTHAVDYIIRTKLANAKHIAYIDWHTLIRIGDGKLTFNRADLTTDVGVTKLTGVADLAHWLWEKRRRDFALYLQSRSSEVFQTDIHPAVPMGRSLFLDHATGLVEPTLSDGAAR